MEFLPLPLKCLRTRLDMGNKHPPQRKWGWIAISICSRYPDMLYILGPVIVKDEYEKDKDEIALVSLLPRLCLC